MFIYNTQFAGYDFDQVDEKGAVTLDEFIPFINNFPWLDQMRQYNSLQQGCSATISVINQATEQVLWLSIGGNDQKHNFLIGYITQKPIKRFLGIGKATIKKWLDIYNISDLDAARQYYTLFFEGKNEELQRCLMLEDLFDSMEVLR